MSVIPEPAGDIKAQIAAALNPDHPKRAVFMVPEDAANLKLDRLPEGVYAAVREEGTLLTSDPMLAEAFDSLDPDLFDFGMAAILGYPEAKPDAEAWCRGDTAMARAVQARDALGHVIHEAIASACRLLDTVEAFKRYVPDGGSLVIMEPEAALARRIAMRRIQG